MRVLHIGEYVKGGVATYLRTLLESQKNNDMIDDIHVAVSHINSEFDLNIDENKMFRYKYKRKISGVIRGIFSINKIIKKVDPNLIHVHSTFAGFMVRTIYFFKRRKNVKIIYSPHGWAFIMDIGEFKKRVYAFIEIILALKTDIIINISNYELSKGLEYGLPKNKLKVVKSGIDPVIKILPIPDIKIDQSKINLLFIGRFDRAKGLDILLGLFKNNDLQNLKLHIIGEGVLNDTETDIPKNVASLGWIDNSIIDSYISLFDAVIIPSRWEGFGLVAIEAMKNKKAIIVSNQAALPELIEQNVNGYIIDISSDKEMLKVLKSLDKETLLSMGNSGYDIFAKKYTSNIMNERIIQIYKSI